ncbi:peptide-methionine (R)-S-oxide reductase MsrB [Allosphingosinicella indica]|uniref:Peptide methionine sulfoxide reductase MsrB n=1 Tax=Allosphingosinicella indica TaxID=941907 RepID=A0A1X7GCC6_9SPHN|nr:peptide-methionine (R)-S-oxide reductase MsrB [Allosphingosinicella indica]SMF67574.1 peptide-methionine (R)-S-oxide reductase [Allosphingosinicella indica]
MTTGTLSASGYDLTPLNDAERTAAEADLTAEEREVLLHHGTERAFCGTLLATKEPGAYACRLCGLPLFRAGAKFESGTGWPSFTEPYDPQHIAEITDHSYGMVRTEIRCARCASHLGHVFPDGPPPTGLRYCLNSVAMVFVPDGSEPARRLPDRA